MPSRRDIFANGNIYHIFNKTTDKKIIFENHTITERFTALMTYYRSSKANIKYSLFLRLPEDLATYKQKEIMTSKSFKIEILAFCLMPNHFHLLIKQKQNNGIVRFMADILNALTRYYNILNERKGPIFLPQFRSRRIHTWEQLIHVSRYIHLNPYSSGLIESVDKLDTFALTSFNEYIKAKNPICNTSIVLSHFQDNKKLYKQFVYNNADYQKNLEYCKHIDKWL